MNELKSIIVEDETMARRSLEILCERIVELNVIGSFENGESALEVLNKEQVDLIFLDIEMPGISGLELLERMPYVPQIIFTTSNKEYAYEAFEYDVTDFLKKPISQPRFQKAVEKALERFQQMEALASSSAQKEIYVKSDGRFIRIPYEEIHYFENVGDYIKVVSNNGNQVFHGTIKSLNDRIQNSRFLKVHRSFIVNLDKIVDIEDNTLVIGEKVIPISRAHKPVLMKSINYFN